MPLQATAYRSHPNRNCTDDKQNTCNGFMNSHIAKDQPLSILSLEKETTNRNVKYLENEINSRKFKMPASRRGAGKSHPGAAHLCRSAKRVSWLAGADAPEANAGAFSSGNGLTNGLF